MAVNPKREKAIQRCLDHGESPAAVSADLGVPASTLRVWLRVARLKRELEVLRQERNDQQQRHELLLAELQQAANKQAELKRLLDAKS
jgi:transposase-like protein